MWDLPGPGLEPMYPALAGRFLTTAPPGKSLDNTFVDSGSFPGKVTQTVIPDRSESLVTLTILGHGCYINPLTIYTFTIKMDHGNTKR